MTTPEEVAKVKNGGGSKNVEKGSVAPPIAVVASSVPASVPLTPIGPGTTKNHIGSPEEIMIEVVVDIDKGLNHTHNLGALVEILESEILLGESTMIG